MYQIEQIESFIESESQTQIILISILLVIVIIQFIANFYFGEKIKKSIENKYNQSLEKYKDELLRRKTIYEEQIDAYKRFVAIRYKIYPEKYYPDMEWDEALEVIADNFKSHYDYFKIYLKENSAILPLDITKKINVIWNLCSDGQFEFTKEGLTSDGKKFADKLWDEIIAVESEFRKRLEIDKD